MGTGCSKGCCHVNAQDELTVTGTPTHLGAPVEQEASVFFKDCPAETSPATCSTVESPESPETLPSSVTDSAQDGVEPAPMCRVESLEDAARTALAAIRVLCAEGRVLDAAGALRRLTTEVAALPPTNEVLQLIREDQQIATLRELEGRMQGALDAMPPRMLPGGPGDSRWVPVDIRDPLLGSDFHADFKMRFATDDERDPHGSATQLILAADLSAFPMDIRGLLSVYRETDLYKKEWIPDCERLVGSVSGPDRLYTALNHVITASPYLPVKLEIITVRDFCVCANSPIVGRGPGVLIMDQGAPTDLTHFAGWELPKSYPRSVRLPGTLSVLYFTPRIDRPDCVDVFAFLKCGIPLPRWILPMSIIKRFVAHHFLNVFKSMKINIRDRWDELEYDERISGSPDLYTAMTGVHPVAAPERASP